MCEGRTVFIIAHRLTTVRHADRIVVVESGKIFENGSHDELIGNKGYYSRLHDYQSTSIPIKARPREEAKEEGVEAAPTSSKKAENTVGFAYGPQKVQSVRLT
jgi:subfamily B ATP-binding cassette protein HlyB/CyaB